ncbi:hypothetical protein J2S78_000133 [Salibacterium salarium]|uniref:hypothetical protein n=1 Tax=Salibacterium salarium TaxID=284579 RepID=UPI00278B4BBD|nr:hypothetical protein [Salibacterium salarium]MDQ0297725.1 hypothetical protein [Salibacterium salarium]
MNFEDIKPNQNLYFLHRDAYNVNDPQQLIIDIEVVQKGNELWARSKKGESISLEFELTPDTLSEMTEGFCPSLFETRRAAQQCYDHDVNAKAEKIMNMPTEDFATKLFVAWCGGDIPDEEIAAAMKDRIKDVTGVDLKS